MREGATGKNKGRRQKRKFGIYLYAIVVLTLTIVNITLAFLLLTHVQDIRVTGTENSSQQEITAWIEEDPLTVNSIYTFWKFKTGNYVLPVYLEDIQISFQAPWKLKAKVWEKQIIGCMLVEDTYICFDAEGLVLAKGEEAGEEVPLIEGIQAEDANQFDYLQVDNEKVFSYVVDLTKEMEKQDLKPDRIVWDDTSMNLYFEQVCVKLGKTNFNEKLLQLPPILEKLQGESGVLYMEHYTSESKNISFEKSAEETEKNY